jgi:GrpB-like predicted nucleotidyltransferase (UPF0157 family)
MDFTVVPYQSDWKEHFEREADLLRSALGEKALRIEHVGSTAIPGVHAKAIIDIMVAVVSLAQAKELIPAMESLGYVYRPIDTIPERMFFRKEHIPEYRTHHLNLATQESGFWKNQIAFRDYLRSHDQIASEYVELKKRWAEVYARTQEIDLDVKTAFVARVLELAEKEEKESSNDRAKSDAQQVGATLL